MTRIHGGIHGGSNDKACAQKPYEVKGDMSAYNFHPCRKPSTVRCHLTRKAGLSANFSVAQVINQGVV